ncbi:MAG: hypothetical protein WD355_08860 [Balneolaceae bacterium]
MNPLHTARLLFISIVTFLFVSSCGLFDDGFLVSKEMAGDWEWQRSTGGFGGLTIHADSVDYSITVRFQRNNRALWHKKDEPIKEYRVEIGEEGWNSGEIIIRAVDNGKSGGINLKLVHYSGGDELTLSDSCFDCFIHYFQRRE